MQGNMLGEEGGGVIEGNNNGMNICVRAKEGKSEKR